MHTVKVQGIELEGDLKSDYSRQENILCLCSSRIATGSYHRKLEVPVKKNTLDVISYCAVCDGAFFKDKKIFVIGGETQLWKKERI